MYTMHTLGFGANANCIHFHKTNNNKYAKRETISQNEGISRRVCVHRLTSRGRFTISARLIVYGVIQLRTNKHIVVYEASN